MAHRSNPPAPRLNLGSGPWTAPGWISIDRSPNIVLDRCRPLKLALRRVGLLQEAHLTPWPHTVVRRDIRRPLPFPAGSVDAVYSSHALEHVYLSEAETILRECHRVLRPGGHLRVALPDSEALATELINADGRTDAGRIFNRRLCSHPEQPPRMRERLRRVVGSPPHRWQPTESLVRDLLGSAGFSDVTRQAYRCGQLPDLDTVEHRPESLFVEAVRR